MLLLLEGIGAKSPEKGTTGEEPASSEEQGAEMEAAADTAPCEDRAEAEGGAEIAPSEQAKETEAETGVEAAPLATDAGQKGAACAPVAEMTPAPRGYVDLGAIVGRMHNIDDKILAHRISRALETAALHFSPEIVWHRQWPEEAEPNAAQTSNEEAEGREQTWAVWATATQAGIVRGQLAAQPQERMEVTVMRCFEKAKTQSALPGVGILLELLIKEVRAAGHSEVRRSPDRAVWLHVLLTHALWQDDVLKLTQALQQQLGGSATESPEKGALVDKDQCEAAIAGWEPSDTGNDGAEAATVPTSEILKTRVQSPSEIWIPRRTASSIISHFEEAWQGGYVPPELPETITLEALREVVEEASANHTSLQARESQLLRKLEEIKIFLSKTYSIDQGHAASVHKSALQEELRDVECRLRDSGPPTASYQILQQVLHELERQSQRVPLGYAAGSVDTGITDVMHAAANLLREVGCAEDSLQVRSWLAELETLTREPLPQTTGALTPGELAFVAARRSLHLMVALCAPLVQPQLQGHELPQTVPELCAMLTPEVLLGTVLPIT